jgi:hypothetical protein
MREEFGDIMRVLLATAPHDKPAAASLIDGTARYRRALVAIARRPADLHALRDGIASSRRLTACGLFRLFRPLPFARRERLEIRTRGTMARRTSELGSTSKFTCLLKVSESRRMREPSSAPRVRQFAHLRDHHRSGKSAPVKKRAKFYGREKDYRWAEHIGRRPS